MNTPAKRHQYRTFPDGTISSEKCTPAEMKDHAKRVLHTIWCRCATGARDQYAQIQVPADDVLVITDYVKELEADALRTRRVNDALNSDLEDAVAERDALRARLVVIEAQEPVAISKAGNLFWAGNPQDWRGVDCSLYATPVPAQAVPAGWRLVPVEPTIAMCIAGDSPRMLVDDCTPTPAIYRAMIAAAPEHKA